MDLSLSDEQIMLQDSASRFLAQHGKTSGAKAGTASPDDDSRNLWSEFAKMGWLGLGLPETYGGLGQGVVDTGILMEAFGRNLVTEPYLSTVVLCAGLVLSGGSEAQRQAILPGVGNGVIQVSLAHVEERARYNLSHVATTASRSDAGWLLNGHKLAVLGGAGADHFLVSARISGDVRATSGIGVFLVDNNAPGLTAQPYATVDHVGAATVGLRDVAVPGSSLLGDDDNALPHLTDAFDRAMACCCAELVGIMDALVAATVDYTKVRVQFGQPLATHQVIRHRLADLSIACEEARSIALRALLLIDQGSVDRSRAVAGAMNKVSRSARLVAEQAVQLHGGMGVTDELNIGSYLKRVVALEALFGSADLHLRRHAALSGRASRSAA